MNKSMEVSSSNPKTNLFPHHFSSYVDLNATAEEAFQFLDDPLKLSSHMEKSSWMMAGSKMEMKLDSHHGKGVGAEIILRGKMMGIPLFIREFVTQCQSPISKVWQTQGPQKLIIMDQYRMGFQLTPHGRTSTLEVFIDYSLPEIGFAFLIGKLFGKTYAKWCTDRMARDAAKHFDRKNPLAVTPPHKPAS